MDLTKETATQNPQPDAAWRRFYEQGLKVFLDQLADRQIRYLPKFAVTVPSGMELRERLAECAASRGIDFRALDCRQPLTRQAVMRFYGELSASSCAMVLMDHVPSLGGQEDGRLLANLLIHGWKNPAIDLDNGATLDTKRYLVVFAVDAGTDRQMEDLWYPGDGFGWYGDLLQS